MIRAGTPRLDEPSRSTLALDALRQVVDALGDGLSQAARAGQLAVQEATGSSQRSVRIWRCRVPRVDRLCGSSILPHGCSSLVSSVNWYWYGPSLLPTSPDITTVDWVVSGTRQVTCLRVASRAFGFHDENAWHGPLLGSAGSNRMILGLLSEWPPPLHEPVERTVDLPTRLRSLATDTSLLIRFHGFDAPLGEPRRVVDYDGVGLDFAAGREAHHLRDDLSTADIESRPRCHDLPAVADPSEALGSL